MSRFRRRGSARTIAQTRSRRKPGTSSHSGSQRRPASYGAPAAWAARISSWIWAAGLAVRRPDDVRERDPRPLHVGLDEDGHVHVVEQDQPAPPAAIGVHPAVLVDRAGQVGDDERREREAGAGARAVLADRPPRVGDVDLQERMHRVLAVHEAQPVDHLVLRARERLHPAGGTVTGAEGASKQVHAADGAGPVARGRECRRSSQVRSRGGAAGPATAASEP